ncbi:MAG: DUF2490 domain-containing protein [Saprospiraceae bacterium]|nr:DUF2490 domain-containing protein [Saprospiraceae bacterium]
MNTEIKYLIPVLMLLLFHCDVYSQSTYQFGALPSLNLNRKLDNDWSLNAKLESRQLFRRGEINGNTDNEYDYILTDFSLIAAKKVGLNSRIAAGYLIRFEDAEVFHRFIQQYVIIQKMSGYRLAHRLLSDQTFSKAEKPEIRFRYRITAEIPLNGESVDPGEFYLKLNNEYINSFQAMEYDLEIRLIPLLGFAKLNQAWTIE